MTDLAGVKLVIWDLDGTLIDSYGIYAAVITEAAELRGIPLPNEHTIRHNFHGSLDESIKGAFDMVDGEDFATLLNDFLRIQAEYYQAPEEHVFKDVYRLAEDIKTLGVAQIVVTNREHAGRDTASPRYLVHESRLKDYISAVVCGDEVSSHKPDPAVINGLAQAQGLQGSEILVIGDQFVDAQLARNLGGRAIIVNRSEEPVPHLDNIADPDSFLRVVKSLNEVDT